MDPLGIIGLADDPALELLNTTAVPVPGQVLELIGDGRAYLDWLTRAGLIDHRDLSAIRDVFGPAELDAAAVVARDLREDLRRLVAAWTAGPSAAIPPETVSRLNTLLEADHRFARLDACARGVELRDRRRWTHAAQLLVPPAGAWARLLARGDPAMVRQCEGCTIWFYDCTKAHRRRWCSMALCGNRAKARRHRQSLAGGKAGDAGLADR